MTLTTAQTDRAAGVLLASAAGDALGVPYEFNYPPSAAELLSGDRLAQLLAHLQATFDHVVIDAPPMLGLADAPMIARVVDGCLFVVEANGVSVRGIRSAVARLEATNAPIIGALLTKLDARQATYGYGYEYGDRYGAQLVES